MATIEVTQYGAPLTRQRGRLPLGRLPALANVKGVLPVAATALAAQTATISVIADADARFWVGGEGVAADANSILIKAGIRTDFEVEPGSYYAAVAAA